MYNYAISILRDELEKCIRERDSAYHWFGEHGGTKNYLTYTKSITHIEHLEEAIAKLTSDYNNTQTQEV